MDAHRRSILKAGASAAAGGLLAAGAGRAAQLDGKQLIGKQLIGKQADGKQPSMAPLSGQAGLRLASCVLTPLGAPVLALVQDNGTLLDIGVEARRQKVKLGFDPASMLSLIKAGNAGLAQLHGLAERATGKANYLPPNDAVFTSPIPRPERNIYCVGWNYLDHFEEGKQVRADKGVDTLPEHPVFFTKGTHTMNGPFDAIAQDPANAASTDWEAEIAVVIGRQGRNISAERAMEYVFGYAAYNDTTVREIQQKRHGGQWFKGKSLDGHGPMGPWLVTAAGVNLDEVRVICRVNGVEKQNASYQQMYFKIPRIIAELSRGMTLEPGDIIATGTPSGVGYARKPPEFLKPGDVMETEITGVGILRNIIKAQS